MHVPVFKKNQTNGSQQSYLCENFMSEKWKLEKKRAVNVILFLFFYSNLSFSLFQYTLDFQFNIEFFANRQIWLSSTRGFQFGLNHCTVLDSENNLSTVYTQNTQKIAAQIYPHMQISNKCPNLNAIQKASRVNAIKL